MNSVKSMIISILLILYTFANAQESVTIAVLDLDTQAGVSKSYQGALTDILREELFHTGRFRVVERKKMENILTEQGFQLSGCTSDECAVKVGQLLGVQQMIAGSVSKLGELYTVSIRLIDVETGEVLDMQSKRCHCSIEEVATTSIADVVLAILGGNSFRRQVKTNRQTLMSSDEPLPGMTFVIIPGGSFIMGSPSTERNRDNDEAPQHQVSIQPFQIMTTEVTQLQWQEIMGNNPSFYKHLAYGPVENVSWNDIQKFIDRLNIRDPGKEYRLPTEAEWEYACRAGTTTMYYSGDTQIDLDKVGWYTTNSGKMTHPVGQKEPNAWGLFDMHGNVSEWCNDLYDYNYYYESPPIDPLGPADGSHRVIRGGSYRNYAKSCRSADRCTYKIYRYRDLGFRLVRSFAS